MRPCFATTLFALLAAASARADIVRYQWTADAGDGLWSTAGNWNEMDGSTSGSGVPLAESVSTIVPGAAHQFTQLKNSGTPTIRVDGRYSIREVQVEWTRWETTNAPYGWRDDGVWQGGSATSTTDMVWNGTVPDARVHITEALRIGWGGGDPSPYQAIDGSLTTNDLELVIGSPAVRAVLELGKKRWTQNKASHGTLTVNGGRFEAYLNDLEIGRHDASGGGGAAVGTLDLSSAGSAMIDVAGSVYLGSAPISGAPYSSYRQGAMHIAHGNIDVAGNLYLGYATGGEDANTPYKKGYLSMTNTTFTVDGQVFMGGREGNQSWQFNTASIEITVDGLNGGLDFTRAEDDTLVIKHPTASNENPEGRIHNRIAVTFASDPLRLDVLDDGWYWGLRWVGDHEDYLEGLLTDGLGRLVIDDSGLAEPLLLRSDPLDYITYDPGTGFTYVGARVPEPSTWLLALLAAPATLFAARRGLRSKP